MTKLMAMVATSLMLCGGCADEDLPLRCWEYQASLPAETATETLVETEARLRSNGYVRVVFRIAFNALTKEQVGVLVFATRTPGKEKEADDGGDEH